MKGKVCSEGVVAQEKDSCRVTLHPAGYLLNTVGFIHTWATALEVMGRVDEDTLEEYDMDGKYELTSILMNST